MPKDPASLFAALGDETRLMLVSRLCDNGPMSITELTAGSKITRQAITKHLRALGEAGLVRSKWRGRESVWQLDQHRIKDAQRCLDLISKQ
jgi:DNA-binding transcriptional ArsR family regulator